MTQELILNTNEVPEYLKDKMQSMLGNENVTADDMTIPRLELIQNMSPCRNKKDPSYIEGAEEGMLYNNVTRELYGEQVHMVFCHFKVEYLLWKDRSKGGGFFGKYDSLAEANSAIDALGEEGQGVQAQKTHQHYGLVLNPETGQIQSVCLSMSRTKEKSSRKLNSLVGMQGGPRFSRVYRVYTMQEQNKNGDTYHNLAFQVSGFPPEIVYEKAKKIYDLVNEGQINANTEYDSAEEVIIEDEF